MMPKYAEIKIKEEAIELKKLLTKHPKEKYRKRTRMLIHLSKGTFRTLQELADELQVARSTLNRWISNYKTRGIKSLYAVEHRKKTSSYITEQIGAKLSEKLNSPSAYFASYREIQQWLQLSYDCNIKYGNLYYHLRKHYKTKLKVPRKSHIKKDEQAVAFFKNTAG